MADALPKPALAPILVFVALDITGQSYLATPRRHSAAVTLVDLSVGGTARVRSFYHRCTTARLIAAAIDPAGTMKATGLTNPDFIGTVGVMVLLAHGFILTAMLWGGAVAFLIDHRITAAAGARCRVRGARVLRLHPLRHADRRDLSALDSGSTLPYQWTAAYLAFAASMILEHLGQHGRAN